MLDHLVHAFPDSLISSLLAISPGVGLITNVVLGKLRLRKVKYIAKVKARVNSKHTKNKKHWFKT